MGYIQHGMEEAFKEVKRNRGSAGVDGVSIKTFEHWGKDNVQVLQRELKEKIYRPRPVKRVFIPIPYRTKRPLGIPNVRGRVVQAAVRRIIEPIFEDKFLDCSFGFRPNKSVHMALEKIQKDLMDGFVHVIDDDLKAYFDTIPQDKRRSHQSMRRKWKGDLPSLRMDKWRSSLSTPVHTALYNEWFVEIGLISLVKLYNDHHLQRG
ncbi:MULTISPECIES: reverse transcriptase domain-containing protein [Bacillaceae]|uniref:reverse transcriptase domain-containing protein n=1 Tax=Bacillaceae TaxID=186817 RepID=UPI000B43D31B|nr:MULTISPECIES: reverse transcriptase domain-containing protein [Bacillaceae]